MLAVQGQDRCRRSNCMHQAMDQGFSKINVVLCTQAQAMGRKVVLVHAFVTLV